VPVRAVRLRPAAPLKLDDYDLDALAVEVGDDETQLDFRFELGSGLGISWALPASRCAMLRLAHVDGAAYTLDEPILVAAPWRCDVAPLAWQGELATLGNGRTLVEARVEAGATPAWYRCELVTRRAGDDPLVTRLAWREGDVAPAELGPEPRRRALDRLLDEIARADDLDLGRIALACDEGGWLFDAGHLDGAGYAPIGDLAAAARRGDPGAIRRALGFWRPAPRPRRPSLVAVELLAGHRSAVEPPAFAPDGRRFVAGDRSGRLIVRERRGDGFAIAAELRVPPAGRSSHPEVRGVAWSPSAELIATQERGAIRLRHPRDLAEVARALHVGDGPLGFGGDGGWLAALGAGNLAILDVPGLARRDTVALKRGDHEYFAADTLAVGGDLAAAADDGGSDETAMGLTTRSGAPAVTVVEVGPGARRRVIEPGGPVAALAIDPWRRLVVVATFDGDVALWSATGELVRRGRPVAGTHVRALCVTESGYLLAPDQHARLVLVTPELEELVAAEVPGGLAPSWIVATRAGDTILTPAADSGIRVFGR
jgi:hypothetical protein